MNMKVRELKKVSWASYERGSLALVRLLKQGACLFREAENTSLGRKQRRR